MAKKEKDLQVLDNTSKAKELPKDATEKPVEEESLKIPKKSRAKAKVSSDAMADKVNDAPANTPEIMAPPKVDESQKSKTAGPKKVKKTLDAALVVESVEGQKADQEKNVVKQSKSDTSSALPGVQDDVKVQTKVSLGAKGKQSREDDAEAFRKTRESIMSTMHNTDLFLSRNLSIELPKRVSVLKPTPATELLTSELRQKVIALPKQAKIILKTMSNIVSYTNIVKPKGRKSNFVGQWLKSPELVEGIRAFTAAQSISQTLFLRAKTHRYLFKAAVTKTAPLTSDTAHVPIDAPPGATPDALAKQNEAEELIAELENTIGPLTYPNSDLSNKVNLSMEHTTHHCSRVLELLIEWVNFLDLLDTGFVSQKTQAPLKLHLINYFSRLLESDFSVSHELGIMTQDERIMARYDLDDIDILILWFVSALQIHPQFRTALAQNWEQGTAIFMHPSIVMRLISNNQVDRSDTMRRLAPTGKLVEAGLLNITQNQYPTMPLFYELRPSEQVVNLLTGTASLSVATAHYAELDYPTMGEEIFLAPSHQKPLNIIKNYRARPPLDKQVNLERGNLNFAPSLAFIVEGLPGSGRSTLIKVIASRLEIPVITVYCSSFASITTMDYEIFMNNLFIDAELLGAAICLRQPSVIMAEERLIAALARNLARRAVVCAICSDIAQTVHALIDPYITFKTRMDANLKDDAQAFWKQHLALPLTEKAAVDVADLSSRLALQPYQIQKSTKLAYYSTDADENNDVILTNQGLELATGLQVSKNIGNLAFISEPEIGLDEVIVNDETMQKILQIIGSSRNRRRVLYEWGLSKHIRRGTGVIALFDGEPGTGKTHCAEAITKMLGLSLMRINIATMVDKYIGETEKNLTTIFEQARPDMSLLLFDEADSLFTKRTSNVTKSTDRYSNMSVNVLLQLIERYEGVSILTTNLKNAIDPAFERRITYKIYFPMPKKPERQRLWRYMCPPDIISEEPIDYEWLSDLEMSGGEIKNAVLTAAYSAATQGRLLNSEILYNAGVSEASAAGRVMKRYEEGEDFF